MLIKECKCKRSDPDLGHLTTNRINISVYQLCWSHLCLTRCLICKGIWYAVLVLTTDHYNRWYEHVTDFKFVESLILGLNPEDE